MAEETTSAVEATEEKPEETTQAEQTSVEATKGKNARKKEKWKREGQLPREPIFSKGDKPEEKKDESNKPFPFQQYRETARKHSELIKGLVNKYFEMRGAVSVVNGNGATVIRTMTCDDFGELTYYTDKKSGAVKGPLSEALAFHLVVAGDGSIAWVDRFIERHRSGVSMFMLAIGVVYIEGAIRSNANLAAEIERRANAASDASASVTETETITVEPK